MPDVYRLTSFAVDALGITVSATMAPQFTNLRRVIEGTLPGATCSRSRARGLQAFSTEERIDIVNIGERTDDLEALLLGMTISLNVVDKCDISQCLDFYRVPSESDEDPEEWHYTELGNFLYRAKYSGSDGAARTLGRAMVEHVVNHPALRNSTAVAAIPSSGESRFRPNLPVYWAGVLAESLGIPVVEIQRTRTVSSQKSVGSMSKRRENQTGSMDLEYEVVDQSVLLIDDLYMGGETMAEGCRALRSAGVRNVFGVAIAKTVKGTTGYQFT